MHTISKETLIIFCKNQDKVLKNHFENINLYEEIYIRSRFRR